MSAELAEKSSQTADMIFFAVMKELMCVYALINFDDVQKKTIIKKSFRSPGESSIICTRNIRERNRAKTECSYFFSFHATQMHNIKVSRRVVESVINVERETSKTR